MVGVLVPFVAAGVWLGLRRMHGRLHAKESQEAAKWQRESAGAGPAPAKS
jgi:hypothetical protein